MTEKEEVKAEGLPDLDDLLQCPVCYEIPTGQIFQCNEGHHVCGRCKARLDVCPVCRALFFGTRNYAMEELIANIRKLRAFKLGGKVTAGSLISESSTPKDKSPAETEQEASVDEENNETVSESTRVAPPAACKGLFRCLCCKNGNPERLPAGRILNHLRYFHSHDLIEGRSENGEYQQAWQFSTVPGRIVTAVRVSDMGIFFLIIEITDDLMFAWLSMAASPWVAHDFCYTLTISGNDREAIFSDCVWSVRSCEGSMKKRGHCLIVTDEDVQALTAPAALSGKLTVKRAPPGQTPLLVAPRAVMRVASRGTARAPTRDPPTDDLEPFLQDLQNDVARLSRAFATLGREANALVRSEADFRARIEQRTPTTESVPPRQPEPVAPLSRNARRRLRQRQMRATLTEVAPSQSTAAGIPAAGTAAAVTPAAGTPAARNPAAGTPTAAPPPSATPSLRVGYIRVVEPEPSSSAQQPAAARANKKRRRRR